MVIWFYHSLVVLILLNWVYIVSYQVTKSIYWKDYYLLLGEAKQSCFIFHYSADSFLVNLFLISPIMWSISKIQSDLPSCKLHMRKQLLSDRLNLLPGTLLGGGYGELWSIYISCASEDWHVSCLHKEYSAIIWRKLQSALPPPPEGLRIECSGEMSIPGNTDHHTVSNAIHRLS